MAWYKVAQMEDIPQMGSRKVIIDETEIALFKTKDDSIFAVNNTCPHKQGKLSEGLVHEHIVTCPLHNTDIHLASGEAIGENYGCAKVYNIKIQNDYIFLEYCN